MAWQPISTLARRLRLAGLGVSLALLAGCAVVPADSYVVGAPVVYPAPAYGVYGYDAAPVYVRPYGWGYWGPPSVSLGFYGHFGGYRGWHGRPGYHGGWGRPGGGHGWGGHRR